MFIKHKTGKERKKSVFSFGLIGGIVLIIFSIGITIFFLITAGKRDLSSLENTLLQIFILATSLSGSYIFGKKSSQASAIEVIKPHARSAFRRVSSLYSSLLRLAKTFDEEIRISVDSSLLKRFRAIIIEQIYTTIDALEDWRDIVPEDVEEIEQRFKENKSNERGISNDR